MTVKNTLKFTLHCQRKSFVVDVALALPVGVNVLFGPSGSGKTTILRYLAGLDQETDFKGEITVDDVCWFQSLHGQKSNSLACHKRAIGYVFQQPSLLPHLTVRQNFEYAKKRAGRSAQKFKQEAQVINRAMGEQLIHLLRLEPLLDCLPSQLSGGEAQRASLARAFFCQPKLLLLDEPLSALDVAHKQALLDFMAPLFATLNIPVVYVTHSLDEVMRLANTLTILEQGLVKQTGDAQRVLTDLAIAASLGRDACVFINGQLCEYDNPWHLMKITLGKATLYLPRTAFPDSLLAKSNPNPNPKPKSKSNNQVLLNSHLDLNAACKIDTKNSVQVRLKINASDVSIALEKPQKSSIQNCIAGVIDEVFIDKQDAYCLVSVWLDDCKVIARLTRKSLSELQLHAGVQVFVLIKSVVITG